MNKFLNKGWKMFIPAGLIVGVMIFQSCKDTSTDSQPPPGNNENCPSGLLHYWKFEENSSPFLDSEGGNSLVSNSITKTAGRVGEGISLINQETLSTSIDSTFNWSSGASFTIEFWMRDSTNSASTEVMIGRDDPGNVPGHDVHWWIGITTNGMPSFLLRDNKRDGVGVSGSVPVVDGNWHHIASVRDNSTNTNYLYVDGQLSGQASYTYTSGFDANNIPVSVGFLNASPYFYYTGDMDELAVYNLALPAADIDKHYQNGLNGKNYCQ